MKFVRSSIIAATAFLSSHTYTLAQAKKIDDSGGFAKLSDLVIVFANLTSVIATFAGFAVLIMLVRGGIAYITSQGDPKALTTARSTLTWAIIGLIVILSAYLIISVIIGFVQVPGLGSFCLPTAGSDAATFCKTGN